MKYKGKKQNDEMSDTECLDVLSGVASQFGIDQWPNTVHGKEAKAVEIARELQKDLKRLTSLESDENEILEPLTEAEIAILRWAAVGKSASVTAILMNVTERSVRNARSNINRKLKSNSLVLSVAKAVKRGLL